VGDDVDGIADYTFVRRLSDAAHGTMYVARAPERLAVGELVGVKVLSGADVEAGLRRATRELRAFAAVRSEYVVAVVDAGRQGPYFFYAMEYCARGSLDEPVEKLDRSEVLQAMAQAARATHALHEAGLIHRGIKPSNVLLADDGARLSDLGLVHFLEPGQTVTGLGSMTAVEYLEPSVLSGHPAGRTSDVWSLGLTLHRALSGEGAYGELPENDPLFCVRRVLSGRPALSADLLPSDADLIARCVDSDPGRRPQTALELAEMLEASA